MANKIEVDGPTRLDHDFTWLWMLAASRDASLWRRYHLKTEQEEFFKDASVCGYRYCSEKMIYATKNSALISPTNSPILRCHLVLPNSPSTTSLLKLLLSRKNSCCCSDLEGSRFIVYFLST